MNYYDMYDTFDQSSPLLDTTLIGIMMICLIVLLVCAVFGLISYILRGIGMYTMARRQGMEYAWLAFVPFARTYLHGELAGTIRLKQKGIGNPGIWLLALPFLYSAISSLLSGIVWFIGFGSLAKVFPYAYMPYGRTDISIGSIMGMIILLIISITISIGYTAVYKTFEVLVNHQILERFTSKNMSIAHAVLCTLVPLYESICFFVMRNAPFNPGMEPPKPQPFMQSPPPGTYYGTPVPPPVPPVPPMGGGCGDSAGAQPPQDSYMAGSSATEFESYGSASAAPETENSEGIGSSGIMNQGNILDSSDNMNSGSVLGATDSVNPGSVLGTTDSVSPGSILGTTDSVSPGSILGTSDSFDYGSNKDTLADQKEKNVESEDGGSDSIVNFILPENENKES